MLAVYQRGVHGEIVERTAIQAEIKPSAEAARSVMLEALSQLDDYANEIRSMTQGQGNFTMEFSRYSRTPRDVQESVLAKHRQKS